jgi:hypothetical protein
MQKQKTPRKHGIACVEYIIDPKTKLKIGTNIPTITLV